MVFLRQSGSLESGEMTPRSEDGSIAWSALHPKGGVWASENYANILPLVLDLRDCLISPERTFLLSMVNVLLSIMPTYHDNNEFLGSEMQGLAKQLTRLNENKPVQPLPAEVYESYRRFCFMQQEHLPKALDLTHDQWTLLVTCEIERETPQDRKPLPRRLRYAFVTLGADDDRQAVNAETFFKSTIPSSEERRKAAIESWNVMNDLQEMIPGLVLEECSFTEVSEALKYLEAFNESIDAYEEVNRERLGRERQCRLDFRAQGQLTI